MIYGIYGMECLLLFLAGIEDIRKKKIHILTIFAMGVTALLGCMLRQDYGWYGALGGFLIGICVIGISIISGEQIGILCGVRNTLGIVCFASLFMLMPALVLVICKKGNKKTKLPFLPALFLGYLVNILLGGMA